MDIKSYFNTVYKNRIIIFCCSVLIIGTIFGTSMTGLLPEEIKRNIFVFLSESENDFSSLFFNIFTLPFIMLFSVFLSGFSTLGKTNCLFILFIDSVLFSFENSINYTYSGMNYIIESLKEQLTAMLFFNFLFIIMAENSYISSENILRIINNKTSEKPHYNTKKHTVKFITFTVIFAILSAFSAYITVLL